MEIKKVIYIKFSLCEDKSAMERTKKDSFVLDTMVREYERYSTWCLRTNSILVPLDDWAAAVCRPLNIDVSLVIETFEQRQGRRPK